MNIWDLPRLNKHTDGSGKNKLCWPNVIGCCFRDRCPFIHEKGQDVLDAFLEWTHRVTFELDHSIRNRADQDED